MSIALVRRTRRQILESISIRDVSIGDTISWRCDLCNCDHIGKVILYRTYDVKVNICITDKSTLNSGYSVLVNFTYKCKIIKS